MKHESLSPDLKDITKEDLVESTTNQRKAKMKRGQTENFMNTKTNDIEKNQLEG